MKIAVAIIFASVILGQSPSSEETRFSSMRRDHYVGFGSGSWVTNSTYLSTGESTEKLVRRTKRMVTEVRDGIPYITRQSYENGKWQTQSEGSVIIQPIDPASLQVVERRSEEFEIDGQMITCNVVEYDYADTMGASKGSVTVWRSSEFALPYRECHLPGIYIGLYPNIVKVDYEARESDTIVSGTRKLLTANQSFDIGERTVDCAIESISLTVTPKNGPAESVLIKLWISNTVLGHEVQEIVEGVHDGQRLRTVERVDDYLSVPPRSSPSQEVDERTYVFKGLVSVNDMIAFGTLRTAWKAESPDEPIMIAFKDANVPPEVLPGFLKLEKFTNFRIHFSGRIESAGPLLTLLGTAEQISADASTVFLLGAIPDKQLPGPDDASATFNPRKEFLNRAEQRTMGRAERLTTAIKTGKDLLFSAKDALGFGLVGNLDSIAHE